MKGFSRTMQSNCINFFSIRVMYLVIEIGLTDLKNFMNKCATNKSWVWKNIFYRLYLVVLVEVILNGAFEISRFALSSLCFIKLAICDIM